MSTLSPLQLTQTLIDLPCDFFAALSCISHTETQKLATSHPTRMGYGCYSNSSGSPFDVGAVSGAKNE